MRSKALMLKTLVVAVAFLATATTPGTAVSPDGRAAPGLPVREMDFSRALVETRSYPALTASGEETLATWRVVSGTGNCCENYLAASPTGRLFDFGGTYLRFTDDKGLTWKELRPLEPLVNGEGAITVAPNGDIIAMTWDPYSGDHILTFKYEAATETWSYSETKLHTPFFDRPWLAVVRGPFTIGNQKFPYVSILMSNFAFWREVWYVSVDGLNYVVPSSRRLDDLQAPAGRFRLRLRPDPAADYFQSQSQSGITSLSGSGALASDMTPFGVGVPTHALVAPSLRWSRIEPLSVPKGRLQVDSRGWMHNVRAPVGKKWFEYSVSADGGRSWVSRKEMLPDRHVNEDFDFKVNGRLGVAAIALHTRNKARKTDQDLVYRFSVARKRPRLSRIYFLGDGDNDIGRGISSSVRFDFPTVAILPDGSIAASFADKAHSSPAVAILLDR